MKIYLFALISVGQANEFAKAGASAWDDLQKAQNHPTFRALGQAAWNHISQATGIESGDANFAGILQEAPRVLMRAAASEEAQNLVQSLPYSDAEKDEIGRLLQGNTVEDALRGLEKIIPDVIKDGAARALQGNNASELFDNAKNFGHRILSNPEFHDSACAGRGNISRALAELVDTHTSGDGNIVHTNETVNRQLDAYCDGNHNDIGWRRLGADALNEAKKALNNHPHARRQLCANTGATFNAAHNGSSSGVFQQALSNHGHTVASALCSSDVDYI